MNRNLFLLAAALQLPVTLWMQGCSKDDKNDDDDNTTRAPTPDGESSSSTTPAPKPDGDKIATLTKGIRDQPARLQRMIDSDHIHFKTVDNVFDANIDVPTATMFVVDTIKEVEQPRGRREVGSYLMTVSHAELVEEFSFETKCNIKKHQLSRNLPGVISSKDVHMWTESTEYPVVFNAQNTNFMSGSAASIAIAQNVSPSGRASDIDASYWNIVAELYTAHEKSSIFPKNQSHHVMSLFAPFSDDCDHFYEISYKTFLMVIFHNLVIEGEPDEDQKQLFKMMHKHNKKEGQQFGDVFQWFKDTRDEPEKKTKVEATDKDQIILDENVGVSFTSRGAVHNKKSIDDARRAIVADVKKFRNMIQQTHRVHFAKQPFVNFEGETEPWDLNKFEHFHKVAAYKLGLTHENTAHNLLQDIRLNLDILYSESDILKKAAKPDNWDEAANGRWEESADSQAWAASDKHMVIKHVDGDRLADMKFPAKDAGMDLDFPVFFFYNLYTMNRDVLPNDDEEWVEFEMRINDNLPIKDQEKFVIPTLKYEDALESYVVKELVVVANDESMHAESVKSMCLGLFDAFEQAHDNLRIARELDRQFVLADLKPHTNNQGKTNWPKNLQGPMREMPTNLKKEMLVTDIRFHTLKSQVEAGHKTVDAILKEFIEQKITVEVEVDAKVQKKAVYQPVRGHGQSRTMQAGF